jgi:non-canonical purine NTP pyrophosphatase (RdgB/HAM1 family)
MSDATGWVLVTGNVNKWREAERILGFAIERVELELDELQAESVSAVALAKAQAAFGKLGRPVIVEDAGVELVGLGGFPGPFIKYWEKLGGLASICRAADGLGERGVRAVCALGVCSASGAQVVTGVALGSISSEPRGTNGFGWDAIFIPEGETRTFGQMTPAEKDAHSHRRKAWELLRQRL